MSTQPLVEARGLGKNYPLVFRRRDRLRALRNLLLGRGGSDAVRVLADVDLEVRRGESLGLIGENGAGKSTLLKLLTGVLTPSHGSVKVHGKVGALLELGAGFHPEYSGRENIAMAAVLQGLTEQEARERLPQIIEFADIGRYIDEPVKHYSSGMVVRLGFAVVASTRPDLLITDEVLAVGDESFQKKCVRWIEGYLEGGGTLILVSHSMYHIQKLCQQACWLRAGRVQSCGDVFRVTQEYLAYHERKGTPGQTNQTTPTGLEFHVESVYVNGTGGDVPLTLGMGCTLRLDIDVAARDGRLPVVHIGIVRADGAPVYGISTDMDGVQPAWTLPGRCHLSVCFDDLPLLPGSYVVRVHPLDPEGLRLFDTRERSITITGRSREVGLIRLCHRWDGVSPKQDHASAQQLGAP